MVVSKDVSNSATAQTQTTRHHSHLLLTRVHSGARLDVAVQSGLPLEDPPQASAMVCRFCTAGDTDFST